MEIKIFTDIIDALEKVGKAITSIKSIPEAKRKKISKAVEDSYTLLNSAINLVLLLSVTYSDPLPSHEPTHPPSHEPTHLCVM